MGKIGQRPSQIDRDVFEFEVVEGVRGVKFYGILNW